MEKVIHLDSHVKKSSVNEEAYQAILKSFDAEGYRFQLTPGGFHAMQHLFMHHYLEEVRQTGRNHFISNAAEKALERMEMLGCGVTLLTADEAGRVDLTALKAAIRTKTSFISITAVHPLTGVMQPVEEIIQICHEKGIKVHVNATHAIGTWGVSLKEWNADYLTFDLLPGMGGLFSKGTVREGAFASDALTPFAQRLEELVAKQETFAMESARLRSEFENELIRAIPDCMIFGREAIRVPHIFTACFPGLLNEALLFYLHRKGVEASLGHLPNAVSFALSHATEEDDLAEVLNATVTSVRKLKQMSLEL